MILTAPTFASSTLDEILGPSFISVVITALFDNSGGSHKICIPLSFRVAVKRLNDKNFHCLIIHSPRDIIEGELEILSSGEQNDEMEKIEWTDNGQINGNTITGVVLEEGKNTIHLLFSDNMRHAIKLNAYENQ